jgi:methanogenic corrinoid protein MtbC1
MLNRQGIKISNIARLNDLEMKEEIIRVTKSSASEDTLVDSMIMAMIDMNEYKLDGIMDKSISQIGFKSTITDVIYPFLEKVGILWQSGEIYPAQEHFVSNLIRQKIIAQVGQIPNTFNPKRKIFVLLLPEGEWHEIALLLAQFMIKEAGHEVIYLGQSVPYSDVLATGAQRPFDYIVVSSTTTQPDFDLVLYLSDLGGAFPDKKILYFSSYLGDKPDVLTENHVQLRTVGQLDDFLEEL